MKQPGSHRYLPQSVVTAQGRIFAALLVFSLGVAHGDELALQAGVTTVLQNSDDNRVETELTASADLVLTLPRSTGEWLMYIEASSTPDANGVSAVYPTANADAGSVLNRDGDGGVQISEFNYTFNIGEDRRLMVGLVNPSAWLDRSRIANDENTEFINGSFKNNATIEFPDYTLGAIMRWLGSPTRPEISLVAASSDGLADLPDRSYQDLLNLSADDRGVFVGGDAKWLRDRTAIRLGAWLSSGDHEVSGRPGEFEMNYGIYSVLGWSDESNAFNFRIGMANENVSVATRFAAASYQRSMRIGLLGFGLASSRIANNFRQADLVDVTSAEAFLRIPLGDGGAQVSPSIQYVENPGFDTSGPTFSSSSVIASVRFHWSFEK